MRRCVALTPDGDEVYALFSRARARSGTDAGHEAQRRVEARAKFWVGPRQRSPEPTTWPPIVLPPEIPKRAECCSPLSAIEFADLF